MDRTELRGLQGPLKSRYVDEPGAALVRLVAEGSLDGDGLSCSVDTGRALVEAGLHPAAGGTGEQACSGDMLLQALAACAGVTLRAVATSMGLAIDGGSMRAEGDFDARGTLGVDRAAPVGLTRVTVTATLRTDAGDADLASLAALTERYCVVGQSLATPASIHVVRAS